MHITTLNHADVVFANDLRLFKYPINGSYLLSDKL